MISGSDRERLYLDHAATSPLRREVWRAMEAELDHCFNPASSHAFGRDAHRCLEIARGRVAESLGCDRIGVHFTGGGTLSDNLAILGFARAHVGERPRILLSTIEHKACLAAADRAAAEGARVAKIPVDSTGTVDVEWLDHALASDPHAPTLVSVMWANNEIGTVQPVAELIETSRAHGALFHTDAVQALGKVPARIDDTPVDLLSATAHKLGGPVGIGILYRRRGVRLEPLSYGGGQEGSIWPGTQNPLGAVGFATALELAVDERETAAAEWLGLRRRLEAHLLEGLPNARIHGAAARERLPHLVSVGIPECDPGAVQVSLDLEGIAVSGGSACSTGSGEASPVLAALGIDTSSPYATVRFSFGHETTVTDVDRAGKTLVRIAQRVLSITV